MKKSFKFLVVLIFLNFGCELESSNIKEGDTSSNANTQTLDSAITALPEVNEMPEKYPLSPELEALLQKFDTTQFRSEVNYQNIDSIPINYGLKPKELSLLISKFQPIPGIIFQDYSAKKVIDILGHKRNKTLQAFQESADIGSIYDGSARALAKTQLNDSVMLLTSLISWQSYPACPSGSGSLVLLTLLHKGEIGQSTYIAAKEIGSDPPAWGEDCLSYKLNKNKVELEFISQYGEYAEDGTQEIDEKKELNTTVFIIGGEFAEGDI